MFLPCILVLLHFPYLANIPSFVFFKFSFPFQVSDSAVNPFQCTKYLFFPLTRHLFRILSTSHSSSSSIITGAGCSLLCPSTCPTYHRILLTFTTRCTFTVLDNSNSTVFNDTTFLCHKLHSVISPPILRRFPQSQSQLKALKKTFRSMPVTSRGDQYWPRY